MNGQLTPVANIVCAHSNAVIMYNSSIRHCSNKFRMYAIITDRKYFLLSNFASGL